MAMLLKCICGKVFKTFKSFEKHIEKEHGEDKNADSKEC